MKKKAVLVLLCLILSLSACGKEARVLDQEGAYRISSCLYLEEGLVYDMLGNSVYYEYDTKTYMPLCAKANCLHDTDDCMSVRFSKVSNLGKIGDKWYYTVNNEDGTNFYSADLDGQNEKKIGTVEFGTGGNCLFYDNSCIYVRTRHVNNEDTGRQEYYTDTICRYRFEEKKEEILCPEIINSSYQIYGKYKNQLIYLELNREKGYTVSSIDLDIGEKMELLGNESGFLAGYLKEKFLMYMTEISGSEGYRIMELDLETGEQREIWEYKGEIGADWPDFAWGEEMKAFSIINSEKDYRKTYLYQEDGTCKQLLEEKYYPIHNFLTVKNGQVIVEFLNDPNSYLATMSIEDFTAGKDNWTRLEY